MTWTALHDACEHQDAFAVVRLARAESGGEDAVAVDDHGSTPLHVLCYWGSTMCKTDQHVVEAVQALLAACPQAASDQDRHGDTPLHIACQWCAKSSKNLVSTVLRACPAAASMTNNEGLMPLHLACRHAPDNVDVIGLLVEMYPYALRHPIKIGNPAPPRRKPGSKSCSCPMLEIGKETDHALIDRNAGLGHKGSLQLRYEATELEAQIRDGAYPLHMAVQAGAPGSVLEMLIREEASVLLKPNKFGETPLLLALKKGESARVDETVAILLRGSPNSVVVMRDKKDGNLPLHTAAAAGCSVQAVKLLLDIWPESICQRNAQGLTPFEVALRNARCSEEVLRLLRAE